MMFKVKYFDFLKFGQIIKKKLWLIIMIGKLWTSCTTWVGLTVKNMCFLLGDHIFKFVGGRVCTPPYIEQSKHYMEGSLSPQTRGSCMSIWHLCRLWP